MSEIIILNVGGEIIMTNKSTLNIKNSFFESLLNDNFIVDKDKNGNIFIDRDPNMFKIILNNIRNGCKLYDNNENIIRELKFYGLDYKVDDKEQKEIDILKSKLSFIEMKVMNLNQQITDLQKKKKYKMCQSGPNISRSFQTIHNLHNNDPHNYKHNSCDPYTTCDKQLSYIASECDNYLSPRRLLFDTDNDFYN